MINCSEIVSRIINVPDDPYGPPLVRFVVRVRERETGRWWYVRSFSRSNGDERKYIFTSDIAYAKLMTQKTARFHQMCMMPDILNK